VSFGPVPNAAAPFDFGRARECAALAMASIAVIFGLWLGTQAKLASSTARAAGETSVNLSQEKNPRRLSELFLKALDSQTDADFAAREWLKSGRVADQAGSLGKVDVPSADIQRDPSLVVYRDRLANPAISGRTKLPLFNMEQVQKIRPFVVVRTVEQYTAAVRKAALIWLVSVWTLFCFWTAVRHGGSQVLLPVAALLSGCGMILMVSSQDPMRDRILATSFSQGVALGVAVAAVLSLLNFHRLTSRLAIVPLIAGLALIALLVMFGSGPERSGAKVNLGPIQPSEIVKVLFVMGLAGLFHGCWVGLRHFLLMRRRLFGLQIPRPIDMLPLAAAIPFVFLFLVLKDSSVAVLCLVVMAAMWAVAHHKWQLLAAGVALSAAAVGTLLVVAPDLLGNIPARLSMWRNAFDNMVRGGDHAAQFIWTVAAGGTTGSGFGLSYSHLVPNSLTDGVFAAWAEQTGFAGCLLLAAVYGVLFACMFRIARRAGTDYLCFLGLGLTVLMAVQTLWIAGAMVNLLPLSGIVSPFLSFGRTSMVANFAILGIMSSISASTNMATTTVDAGRPFEIPIRTIRWIAAVAGIVLLLGVAHYQVWGAEAVTLRTAQTRAWASPARITVSNPRLAAVASLVPRGEILDANGIPICASSVDRLLPYEDFYGQFGFNVRDLNPGRHLCPAVTYLFHVLGDYRRAVLMQADRQVERRFDTQLRGWSTERDLLPLIWWRNDPDHPEVQRLLRNDRPLQLTIDLRWQLLSARTIEREAARGSFQRFGWVVLNPQTGGILAAVSYPWPRTLAPNQAAAVDSKAELRDNARIEVFQPGSSFKSVVAMSKLIAGGEPWTYRCVGLSHDRNGCAIPGLGRAVVDDPEDKHPHGSVGMIDGFAHSCNCYFASLGYLDVGAKRVGAVAKMFEMKFDASKGGYDAAQEMFGQGAVSSSALSMASVWATIANHGARVEPSLVASAQTRTTRQVMTPDAASILGVAGRAVVTRGTAHTALSGNRAMPYGKTGTAQNDSPGGEHLVSHSWFAGAAPYRSPHQVAFSAVAPNAGYGAKVAAPLAGKILETAFVKGLFPSATERRSN
jgi:cell division protein FtsW (lipid II flippase)